jgi:hypothetical protein
MLNTACFTIDEVGLRSVFLLDFFIKVIIICFLSKRRFFAMVWLWKLLKNLDKEEKKWQKPSDCIS